MIKELNERSREILRLIVEDFLETGEPVGSRTLSQRLGRLSPASIRNVMKELEERELLSAPHTSAGRQPTEAGLRLFIDGMLQIGNVSASEREQLEAQMAVSGKNLPQMLDELTGKLSGLSSCAGLVVVPQAEERSLKYMQFVNLGERRVLAILVSEGGMVENRVIELDFDVPASALASAANFMKAHLTGKSLSEMREDIRDEMEKRRHELDGLTQKLVEAGLAVWSGEKTDGHLIVRGQAELLKNVQAMQDLERIRSLFETLETRETMLGLVDAARDAKGVQIFIGAENRLFTNSGCSMIVAPYRNGKERVVGAIGVIGPVRMNYRRIIPMVDYTAKLLKRHVG